MEKTYINPKIKKMLEIAQKNMMISKIKNNEEITITKEENKNEDCNELFLSDQKF